MHSSKTQRIDFIAPAPTNELAERSYLDQAPVTTEHVATVRIPVFRCGETQNGNTWFATLQCMDNCTCGAR